MATSPQHGVVDTDNQVFGVPNLYIADGSVVPSSLAVNPQVTINGLPLPSALVALIEAGRWCVPADRSGPDRLFPDRGDFMLYSLEYMPFENRHWIERTYQ